MSRATRKRAALIAALEKIKAKPNDKLNKNKLHLMDPNNTTWIIQRNFKFKNIYETKKSTVDDTATY